MKKKQTLEKSIKELKEARDDFINILLDGICKLLHICRHPNVKEVAPTTIERFEYDVDKIYECQNCKRRIYKLFNGKLVGYKKLKRWGGH